MSSVIETVSYWTLNSWETAMCCSSIFFLAKFLILSWSNSLSYFTIWSTKLRWSNFLNKDKVEHQNTFQLWYCFWPKWMKKCLYIFVWASFGRATLNSHGIHGNDCQGTKFIASQVRVQSEGNLLSFEFFSVHMLKKNRWKFNAFFPYQLWNFLLYYQG